MRVIGFYAKNEEKLCVIYEKMVKLKTYIEEKGAILLHTQSFLNRGIECTLRFCRFGGYEA